MMSRITLNLRKAGRSTDFTVNVGVRDISSRRRIEQLGPGQASCRSASFVSGLPLEFAHLTTHSFPADLGNSTQTIHC